MTNLTWRRMLDRITAIVRQHGPMAASVEQKQTILSLLEHYQPNESDYRPYVHFHERGYTKNLVRELDEAQCNVIVMCWAANQSSLFHAHEGSRCFVKVLAGQLAEQQVPYPRGTDEHLKIQTSHDKILSTNDVTYIDDSIGLHKVSNISATKPAITLHVYMPAYKRCRVFDTSYDNQGSGHLMLSRSLEVTFNSVHGKSTN